MAAGCARNMNQESCVTLDLAKTHTDFTLLLALGVKLQNV